MCVSWRDSRTNGPAGAERSPAERQIRTFGWQGNTLLRVEHSEPYLTDEVTRMMWDRPASQVWLTLVEPGTAADFDALARRAGLEPLGRAWIEVDAAQARRFLVAILHRDLAYKSVVMPEHRAEWLADEFLGAFGRFNSRFATNSADSPDGFPFSWTPATACAFDAGVAVLGESGAGLYWVADED